MDSLGGIHVEGNDVDLMEQSEVCETFRVVKG